MNKEKKDKQTEKPKGAVNPFEDKAFKNAVSKVMKTPVEQVKSKEEGK